MARRIAAIVMVPMINSIRVKPVIRHADWLTEQICAWSRCTTTHRGSTLLLKPS